MADHFYVDKYKALHIGGDNDRITYSVNGSELVKVNEEEDIGVTIASDVKTRKHCSEVVRTANNLVAFFG